MPLDMNIKILIVDDSRPMLKIIRSLLKQIGLGNVEEATDGHEALKKLQAEPGWGLIVSDWNMEPGMNGLPFLKEVRANPALKHIPFVMITAESKTDNVIAAKQAGVNNYIVKPFNAETLKGKLKAVFGDF